MEIHHQQIRAAPQRPVTLADRDAAVLIAVLAVLEGEVLSGEASPHMTGTSATAWRGTSCSRPTRPAKGWPGR
jgi:hypothetical protein